ncbi:MAG: hypothetical protein ACI9BV_003903 [Rhodothermales bacterium]|jgi:hypothetical protein
METNTQFRLGRVYLTPGASLTLQSAGQSPAELLRRHELCDWGDVCGEDWRANDEAVRAGGRILSAYTTRKGDRIWALTEAGRHCTTLLLPAEY